MLLRSVIVCLWAFAGRAQASDAPTYTTLEVGGKARTYAAHVPASWDGHTPLPLVVVFHGSGHEKAGHKGAQIEKITHFDAISDKAGFLVLYPDGYLQRWADGRNDSTAEREGVDDLAFVDALLADVGTRWPVDSRRIYATGFSNGAFFSQRLGCARSGRFAAIAPVAGTLPVGLTCAPSGPVPIVAFLNVADPIVPWAGGEILGHGGQSVAGMADLAFWARNNGCTGGPAEEALPDARADGTTVSRLSWTGCAADTVLYRVTGGGHTWPGGRQYLPGLFIGRTSRDIDASALIWDFFLNHPQPAASP